MKSIELKIKIKHLAEEARIIRREAHKQYEAGNYQKGNDLTNHRTGKLRREARATLLAYQCLRGIPYAVCEQKPKTTPDWKAFERMCKQYGDADSGWESWATTTSSASKAA